MLWMIGCSVRLKSLPRRSGCMMLNCNVHVNQLPTSSGSYVVASTWSHLQDALGATLYRPLEVTSKTLWMLYWQHPFQSTSKKLWKLRCNYDLKSLARCPGCYVGPSTWKSFHDALDVCCNIHFNQLQRSSGSYIVKSTWSHFQEALDARSGCNIPFNQVPRRSRCYGITYISSQSERLCMLRCNVFPNKLQDALDATL